VYFKVSKHKNTWKDYAHKSSKFNKIWYHKKGISTQRGSDRNNSNEHLVKSARLPSIRDESSFIDAIDYD